MAQGSARSDPEEAAPKRHFLGWDGPPIARAAEWIHTQLGDDAGNWIVALPGAQGGRALGRALARRAGPGAVPPRFVTSGTLTDELVTLHGRKADRLARTLAWARALEALGPTELVRLVARVPAAGELRAWMRLAEEARRTFGELAAEGLDFAAAVERVEWTAAGERGRFEVLARAQETMRALLAEAGLEDPHLARLAALEEGRVDADARVLLVGVVELNELTRRALAVSPGNVTALVFAPEARAVDFDALGCLELDRWREAQLELPTERWHVVDRPVDQAERAVALLAGFEGRFAADEISLGAGDTEVAPYLARRLAEEGVVARDAAGTPFKESAPARLVEASARWLASRSYPDYAALVRHPDLEAGLRAGDAGDVVTGLDDYHERHLPARVGEEWLGGSARRDALHARHARLSELLGELLADESRPLHAWAGPARAFLEAVYAPRLAPERGPQRELVAALRLLGRALGELEQVPEAIAPECKAHEALELALGAHRADALPPPRAGEAPSIDVLGWLELPLDEARALVVTGFVDGRIPETVRDDAFLPDGLRRTLHMPDDAARLARDLYAAELLLHSREEVHFVSGRRSRAGDPLLPSRLALRVPPAEVVARVRHWLPPKEDAAPAIQHAELPAVVLPRLAGSHEPEVWSVTAFGTYLRSPYLFYLRHVLRLETLDDRARELDPLAFGNLAHAVLEAFGKGEARDATEAGPIAAFLDARLDLEVQRRFGKSPLPAVELQREQLRWRLARFAEVQAERARAGWRIAHVEWAPADDGCVTLPMGAGEAPIRLKGRIDRIDRRAGKNGDEWAILDYKTGENPPDPKSAHMKRGGEFRDLQLPLYGLLAAELDMGEAPTFGYVTLGNEGGRIGVREFQDEDGELVVRAHEKASEVVRKVRDGELFELGEGMPQQDVILQAIAGEGLLAGAADEGDEDGEAAA